MRRGTHKRGIWELEKEDESQTSFLNDFIQYHKINDRPRGPQIELSQTVFLDKV